MNWSEAERPQAIREALQEIEAEIPRLRRYARCLGYEPDHADDLVQEGLVRAVAEIPTPTAKIHTGPPGTSLRGWLFAILRSCHSDETRRRGQRPDAPASTRASPTTRHNQEAGPALSTLRDALFWSCGGCVGLATVVGFSWGGWTTGGSAQDMAGKAAASEQFLTFWELPVGIRIGSLEAARSLRRAGRKFFPPHEQSDAKFRRVD